MSSGYQDYFKAVRTKGAAAPKAKKATSTQGHSQQRVRTKKKKPLTVEEALNRVDKKSKQSRPRKRKKQKSSFPFVSSFLGLALTLSGLYYYEDVENFLDKVEITIFGTSHAQGKVKKASMGAAKNAGAKVGNEEKSATSSSAQSANQGRSRNQISAEELSHYSKLRDRKQQLDLREAELNELEEELHKQKKEIEARIRQLEKMRGQIAGVLKERVKVDEERVKKLVDFYSNMKPQQAAKILETLNENLAVEIIGKMKKKNAAAILNLLKPRKAQMISEKFAGYKRR